MERCVRPRQVRGGEFRQSIPKGIPFNVYQALSCNLSGWQSASSPKMTSAASANAFSIAGDTCEMKRVEARLRNPPRLDVPVLD